jgi:hypothetical protein
MRQRIAVTAFVTLAGCAALAGPPPVAAATAQTVARIVVAPAIVPPGDSADHLDLVLHGQTGFDRRQLVATVYSMTGSIIAGKKVSWSTSNSAIATSYAGAITAHSAGEAVLTAGVSGSKTKGSIPVCVVDVTNYHVTPLDSLRRAITFAPDQDTVHAGDVRRYTVAASYLPNATPNPLCTHWRVTGDTTAARIDRTGRAVALPVATYKRWSATLYFPGEVMSGAWLGSAANVTQRYVSDANTVVNGQPAAFVLSPPAAWTASISAARWIWSTPTVLDPTRQDDEVFTRTFSATSSTIAATIEIAADDGYRIAVNGQLVVDSIATVNPTTFSSVAHYTIPRTALLVGQNTLTITVRNFPSADPNPANNPAGLLYSLTVASSAAPALSRPRLSIPVRKPVIDRRSANNSNNSLK